MGKVVDITEKLDFDSNPKIKIKGEEYEVNADAETVLKVMGQFGADGGLSPGAIVKIYELLFDEKERKRLKKLNLQFKDFQTIVNEATDLIIGENEGE